MILLLVLPAFADQGCTPLGEAEFRSLLLDTRTAVDNADRSLHRTFVEEIEGRVPCLTFVPSQREWAEFLVALALLEFGDGGDWESPLEAALRLRPGVDRGVGPAHPMARFEPGDPPPNDSDPVPEGLALYVDGELADRLPPSNGMHLVQKEEDGYWATVLLVDEPISAAWLNEPIERPVEWVLEGSGGLGVGAGYLAQRPDLVVEPAFVPQEDLVEILPMLFLRASGQRQRLGLSGNVALAAPDLSRLGASYAQAALSVVLGPAWLGGGVGVAGSTVVEGVSARGDELEWEPRDLTLPYGLVAVRANLDRSRPLDLALSVGAGPSILRVDASGAVILQVSGTPVHLGVTTQAQRASFAQEGFPDHGSTSWQLRAGLELGWAWVPSERRFP